MVRLSSTANAFHVLVDLMYFWWKLVFRVDSIAFFSRNIFN